MAKLIKKRMTAEFEGDFVIFLIGMRINKFWKFNKWWPAAMSMPKMLKELYANPGSGFLGAEMGGIGNPTMMLQYWRSFDQLIAYARNKDAHHYPAWVAFNKRMKGNGDVGIWHETYLIKAGNYECIYNNMPLFGLGKASKTVEATGHLENAADRVRNTSSNN